MGKAAGRALLTASGQSQAVEGLVRITTTNVIATYHLPAMLKRIRAEAPGVEVEIVASNEVRDLTQREADIAIRHTRPEQPDLIIKLVGETSRYFYAAKDYLDRHGRPRTAAELSRTEITGFTDMECALSNLNALGLT